LLPVELPKLLLDCHSKRDLPSCRPSWLPLLRGPSVDRKAITNIGLLTLFWITKESYPDTYIHWIVMYNFVINKFQYW
jgi:hypothetical protein